MHAGIRPPKSICMALTFLLAIGLTTPVSAQPANPAPAPSGKSSSGKELIAVLDLDAVGSSKTEASAMSDRLREELLKTGKYTLVDRQQMEAVLGEQAFQQAGCTSAECAVKVGKVLGARKLVTGRVTKIDDQHWLLSANIIDVETAETLRSESLPHEGPYFSMLVTGIHTLALRLTGAEEYERRACGSAGAAAGGRGSGRAYPGAGARTEARGEEGILGLALGSFGRARHRGGCCVPADQEEQHFNYIIYTFPGALDPDLFQLQRVRDRDCNLVGMPRMHADRRAPHEDGSRERTL